MPPLRLLLLLFSALSLSSARRHHISFPSPNLLPSSLSWDPQAQHFLIGSSNLPIITSISDAGVAETLIDDSPSLPKNSSFPFIALDNRRRRLLAVVSGGGGGASLAAYNLSSPNHRILLTQLPISPSALAVDPSSGAAFVGGAVGGDIFRVDLAGNSSLFTSAGSGGIDAIAVVKGYLLVMTSGGKLYRVDEEGGKGREVIAAGERGGAAALAARKDGSLAVVWRNKVESLVSNDGWGEAAVYEEVVIGDGRRQCGGAAARGRSVYVLIVDERERDRGRIEEVEWRREEEGEWIMGMVLLGLGMMYFMYWRFQMGRLVGNMNKKRA